MQDTPRALITAYGNGGFRVLGERYDGSIILLNDRVHAWSVSSISTIVPDDFRMFAEHEGKLDTLLLGCGMTSVAVPQTIRTFLREIGIVVDAMNTGAACRTYNLLVSDDRQIAAAIIAIA